MSKSVPFCFFDDDEACESVKPAEEIWTDGLEGEYVNGCHEFTGIKF